MQELWLEPLKSYYVRERVGNGQRKVPKVHAQDRVEEGASKGLPGNVARWGESRLAAKRKASMENNNKENHQKAVELIQKGVRKHHIMRQLSLHGTYWMNYITKTTAKGQAEHMKHIAFMFMVQVEQQKQQQ